MEQDRGPPRGGTPRPRVVPPPPLPPPSRRVGPPAAAAARGGRWRLARWRRAGRWHGQLWSGGAAGGSGGARAVHPGATDGAPRVLGGRAAHRGAVGRAGNGDCGGGGNAGVAAAGQWRDKRCGMCQTVCVGQRLPTSPHRWLSRALHVRTYTGGVGSPRSAHARCGCSCAPRRPTPPPVHPVRPSRVGTPLGGAPPPPPSLKA